MTGLECHPPEAVELCPGIPGNRLRLAGQGGTPGTTTPCLQAGRRAGDTSSGLFIHQCIKFIRVNGSTGHWPVSSPLGDRSFLSTLEADLRPPQTAQPQCPERPGGTGMVAGRVVGNWPACFPRACFAGNSGALAAFRRVARDYLHPVDPQQTLRQQLRRALLDIYHRRDKSSRDYPCKKKERPAEILAIQFATPQAVSSSLE